jgi:hypothetical protein
MSTSKITAIAIAAAQAGSLQKQVEAFIEKARTLADGGLTFAEAGQLGMAFLEMSVQAAEELADASGEEKLAAVLDAFGYVWDLIIWPALPLGYFAMFRGLLAKPARAIAMAIAEGLVEAAVSKLKAKATVPAVAVAVTK